MPQDPQANASVQDPHVWDFGAVKAGAVLEHAFVLTNDSAKDLVIKDTTTSCGCTVSEIKKKQLKPGESTTISIKLDTKGYTGDVQQFVYVNTDSMDKPIIRFTVKARKCACRDPAIYFETIGGGNGMIGLQLRMALLLGVLFAIIYAIVVMVGTYLGFHNFYFYLAISRRHNDCPVFYRAEDRGMDHAGPLCHEERESAACVEMVESLAQKGRNSLPPQSGISPTNLPNAFAFGRGVKDGRICVTSGIMSLLDETRAARRGRP